MRHIRQINSVGTESYTVVIANEPLEQHPSIVENPTLFEISGFIWEYYFAKFHEAPFSYDDIWFTVLGALIGTILL